MGGLVVGWWVGSGLRGQRSPSVAAPITPAANFPKWKKKKKELKKKRRRKRRQKNLRKEEEKRSISLGSSYTDGKLSKWKKRKMKKKSKGKKKKGKKIH